MTDSILLLKGSEIEELLQKRQHEVLSVIKQTYQVHASGHTTMPPNAYLRFPDMEKERIIAKPAFLGGGFNTAGIKWIASFPNNITKGLERASAILVLNSTSTGHPLAVMESSIISAQRTAASAAIAAEQIYPYDSVDSVGLVGCGLINYETLRYLLAVYPMIRTVHLLDLSQERSLQFKDMVSALNSNLKIVVDDDFSQLLTTSPIIAFGTTAVVPFISSLAEHRQHTVILHTSLRDIEAHLIPTADIIVDDIDQICSNQTSVHLAEQQVGNRRFIRTTIGDILNDDAPPCDMEKKIHIFNPFGLGILDMGLAHLIYNTALDEEIGTTIDGFLPTPWIKR